MAHDIFNNALRFLTFMMGITLLILSVLPPLISSHGSHGIKTHDNVPCGVNLIKNPSFETNSMRGNDISPWSASGHFSAWSASTDRASHGDNSLRMWTKDACWVGQHFDHEEGLYTASVSVLWKPADKKKKDNSPSLEKKETCKVIVRNSGKVVFEKPKDMQPGKWRRYGFRFTSVEKQQIRIGKGNFELGLICTGMRKKTINGEDDAEPADVYYFDDVLVKKDCKKVPTHDEL